MWHAKNAFSARSLAKENERCFCITLDGNVGTTNEQICKQDPSKAPNQAFLVFSSSIALKLPCNAMLPRFRQHIFFLLCGQESVQMCLPAPKI